MGPDRTGRTRGSYNHVVVSIISDAGRNVLESQGLPVVAAAVSRNGWLGKAMNYMESYVGWQWSARTTGVPGSVVRFCVKWYPVCGTCLNRTRLIHETGSTTENCRAPNGALDRRTL